MNFLSLERSGSHKLLSDPGIWIVGTGETVHETPHNVVIIELRKGGSEDSVIVGNGQKV